MTGATARIVRPGAAFTTAQTTAGGNAVPALTSGGVLLDANGAGIVTVLPTAIYGLVITKGSGDSINVSAGSAYVPAASGIVTYAGGTNLSAGTLGANQWHQVFLTEAGALEIVNNTDPPAAVYAGSARKGATGGNRRWIGAFRTNEGNSIYDADAKGAGDCLQYIWLADTTSAPFRVISGSSSASFAAVSLAPVVPRYAVSRALKNLQLNYTSTANASLSSALSINGVNISYQVELNIATTSSFPGVSGWIPVDASQPRVFYRTQVRTPGVGPAAYLDIIGFEVMR